MATQSTFFLSTFKCWRINVQFPTAQFYIDDGFDFGIDSFFSTRSSHFFFVFLRNSTQSIWTEQIRVCTCLNSLFEKRKKKKNVTKREQEKFLIFCLCCWSRFNAVLFVCLLNVYFSTFNLLSLKTFLFRLYSTLTPENNIANHFRLEK